MAGESRYFFYNPDTFKKVLYLENKNKNHKDKTQVLHYSRPSAGRIVLKGTNEFQDSISIVLDRINKKYPLVEGRNSNIKAY